MTLYVAPQLLWDAEEVFGCVGTCAGDAGSAIQGFTPFTDPALVVGINIKDDDAVSTDARPDADSLKVGVALHGESNVSWAEFAIPGVLERIFACGVLTGDHYRAFAVDGSVNQPFGERLDELLNVHLI